MREADTRESMKHRDFAYWCAATPLSRRTCGLLSKLSLRAPRGYAGFTTRPAALRQLVQPTVVTNASLALVSASSAALPSLLWR